MTDAEHIERLRRVVDDPYGIPPVPISESVEWALATIEAQGKRLATLESIIALHAGTAKGVVASIFELAERECGHSPVSAWHGLTTIEEWISRAKARIAELEAALKTIAELQELNSVPIPRYEQARVIARKALGGKRD